jgi:DNA-directed RNA polymerase specialized sigma24 family protein
VEQSKTPISLSETVNLTVGASRSFSEFVIASRHRLLRAVIAHHGPQIGTEALADAYAYAWQHWDRVRRVQNPTGYVFRAADRIGIQRSRKSWRETPDGVTHGTETGWCDNVAHPEVISVLRVLPVRQRAAVLLVHGYGFSYKEAAETLDIPITTLTNDATRGLARLRMQAAADRQRDPEINA